MTSRGDKDELIGTWTHFLSFSLWVSLPCSLVSKLMGKFNLNCQVKLTSLRLRKATSTFCLLPSAAPWERALLSATGFSWELVFWALHRWGTGVTAPILHTHTPSHLEEVWGALAMHKARQTLHSVTLTLLLLPRHSHAAPGMTTHDRKTLGLLCALLLCPS